MLRQKLSTRRRLVYLILLLYCCTTVIQVYIVRLYLLQEDHVRAVRIDSFDGIVGVRIYCLGCRIKPLDQAYGPIDQVRRLHTPPGRHVLFWEAVIFGAGKRGSRRRKSSIR